MQLYVAQRPDGRREIILGDHSFSVRDDKQEAAIPQELLQDLLLSDLPDEIGVRPLGLTLPRAAGRQMDCWLYGFRDGYASARIQVSEPGGPSSWLMALREAVRKRQEDRGDVEANDVYGVGGNAVFSFLVDLVENTPIPEALKRIGLVLSKLECNLPPAPKSLKRLPKLP